MDRSDFTRAAFEPAHRPKLLAALQSDGLLRQVARDRLAEIAQIERSRGPIRDVCHITRVEHETLTRMLTQVGEPT